MSQLRKAFYRTQQMRACEGKAWDMLGFTDSELMAAAGLAAFNTLRAYYPDVRVIAVFCGGGNNGGDGYVLAKLAQEAGFLVTIYSCQPMDKLPVTAHDAALAAVLSGVLLANVHDGIDADVELIVDALLGIGLQGEVRGAVGHAISLMNDSALPILSLDIPSGLDADTGRASSLCVRADVTVTFIAEKVGLVTRDGPDYCGQVVCHSLQLDVCLASLSPAAYLLDDSLLQGILPPRRHNSHKGLYGHVLVIGGGPGMPGAAHLAAHAALRTGAGMVTVATHPQYANHALLGLPEVMVHGLLDETTLLPLLAKATVCVFGPGLGDSDWAASLFGVVLSAQLPLVIDASGLRLLARHPQHDDNWILTPHPGEAASLLADSVASVQEDRCQAAKLIQQQYGGCVVLKGVGSIVTAGEEQTYINTLGNPGMATAGMGDVLSGIIGGLLAQGVSLLDAAKLGVWLHARAADDAVATAGERGLMASDVMPYLRRRLNPF